MNAEHKGAMPAKFNFKPIADGIEGAYFLRDDSRITSNIYLFEHEGKKLIVDAGDGRDILPFTPDICFLTHGHFDHVGGVKTGWKEVFIHPSETITSKFAVIPVNAHPLPSTSFDFGKFHFEIIHTPGHTPGSMCLFETNNSILVSGDTLFAGGGFGRTDLGGEGAEEKMQESLEILSRLDWKILCPGHGELEFK